MAGKEAVAVAASWSLGAPLVVGMKLASAAVVSHYGTKQGCFETQNFTLPISSRMSEESQ